jgi:hypothetical protein
MEDLDTILEGLLAERAAEWQGRSGVRRVIARIQIGLWAWRQALSQVMLHPVRNNHCGITCADMATTTPNDGLSGSAPPEDRPAGISHDFGDLIKKNPHRFRVLGINNVRIKYLAINLSLTLHDHESDSIFADVFCINAVDYSLRPRNPNCILGGPPPEFYEEHEMLDTSLQLVPGGDGEEFEPPLKFCLLVLDQSYVIAERFEIRTSSQKSCGGASGSNFATKNPPGSGGTE